MDTKGKRLEEINTYLGIDLKECTIETMLKLVWHIEQKGYKFLIEDLSKLTNVSNWEIRVIRLRDGLEIPYCKECTEITFELLGEMGLEYCLACSISKWCKYEKYLEEELIWRKTPSIPDLKAEVFFKIENKELLLYRILDEDYYGLEYISYKGEIIKQELKNFDFYEGVKSYTERLFLNTLSQIIRNPEKYNLNNYKQTNKMATLQDISKANLEAMKAKNPVAKALFSTLKGAIETELKSSDKTEKEIIEKLAKKFTENAKVMNTPEAAEEIELLKPFLPLTLDTSLYIDMAKTIVDANPTVVAEIKNGVNAKLGFLVGTFMKTAKANYPGMSVDPALVNDTIKSLL